MKRKQSQQRIRGDSGQQRRMLTAAVFLGALGFIPVILQLAGLMLVKFDYYSPRALRNQTRTTLVTADRGTIYDRNMNILAYSAGVETVYLNPHELRQSGADLPEIAAFLGEQLDREAEWIEKQGRDFRLRYKKIGENVEPETAAAIRAYIRSHEISGIHLEPSTRRVYPYHTLAAQVIGFTNASNTGCEGVEAAYNDYLEGTAGKVITTKGGNEMDLPYSYEKFVEAHRGSSVVLTLDVTVQACLEKQMRLAVERYQVKNGAFGLVMDAKTGEILAMATLDSYDPNDYQALKNPGDIEKIRQLELEYRKHPADSQAYAAGKKAWQQAMTAARLKQWRNRCISDGYEPGSTFKVVTMAAALDCGAIDLNTGFYCSGSEQIPGRAQRLHCWKAAGHGSEQTPQAIQNSCNIAFAHIALKMGGENFYDYVKRFGILEKTGIDLGGESRGVFFDRALIADTDKWGTASLTSGSFGQTFKITPLQLARAVAAAVNGGWLVEPYLVSEVIDRREQTVFLQQPTRTARAIRPETSRTMCRLLESVVTEGTAKNAAVAGFSIGGKTGTSEKIDVFDSQGRRVRDKIVSFIGVAPMSDPRYIVLVGLDTPSGASGYYISGGVMAAPTVGAVMADILPYLEVKPENGAGQMIPVADLTGLTAGEAEQTLKEQTLTAEKIGEGDRVTGQIPLPGQLLPGQSRVLLYFGSPLPPGKTAVPNFIGMTHARAAQAARRAGLYILAQGSSGEEPSVAVTRQSLLPGTEVSRGSTVELLFTDSKVQD